MAPRREPVETPEVDALPGVPLPHERDRLIGHTAAEATLLEAYRSERLHHAWILGGPKGIGKATLAFRLARFAVAHPDRFGPETASKNTLRVPEDHPAARQLKGGGHPNILHLRRPWDEKSKRFKSDLPVDEIRRTVSFFGTTASANAWRLCIVDAADDMNISSANALLKILEEPPERCLFLVLSHAPGRLLPTIRSRCRRLDLAPLEPEEIITGLRELAPSALPSEADLMEIAKTADGSLRSALTLLSGDGLTIAKGVRQLAETAKGLDLAAVHALADLVAARGQSDNWDSFQHIAETWLHARMRQALKSGIPNAFEYVGLWEKTKKAIGESDALNLDRKQVVLDFFLALRGLQAF
ncbi:DNA polymerase III subunit delta' [Roseibium aggregatum]|uniref:DNA polymerase III subunit delta n=1 Tax=Roseibium aggregatum TaxID=187304 RepID=A0A939EDC9_9HYPH|nr:DNA polymerase III subunit delta' [Roseibium aggregatum]MBN9670624.1 DNA polymerase III subunit delta' [Roseibium aggregatum]